MAHPHWPLFDLRISTPRLQLRPDWDDGIAELAPVAAQGIHDPATMPFSVPWTDQAPGGPLEQRMYQYYWGQRAQWTPQSWNCTFLVSHGGRLVGAQAMFAKDFAKTRVVETGSWLGRASQGKGIGTEMRAAVLHLAFAGLSAQHARSGAWHDNAPSLRVSRRLGYVDNGEEIRLRRDDADRMQLLVLSREAWAAHRFGAEIEVSGLGACLSLFGLAPGGSASSAS